MPDTPFPPPTLDSLTDDLIDQYSMEGQVPILDNYHDDRSQTPLVYSGQQIDTNLMLIAAGKTGHYRGLDTWLYEALTRHPITNQTVAIMGSAEQGFGPWYECVALHYGGQPTTIEYNPVHFDDDRLTALTPEQYGQNPHLFDAAISISSFEHDGLGRYGDPINPDGDIAAMDTMKTILKPDGLLFLSVPLGLDKVIFNEHRIYGRIRLPKLLAGWKLIDSVGYDEALLDRDTGWGWEPKQGFKEGVYTSDEWLHPDYPEYGPILVLANV